MTKAQLIALMNIALASKQPITAKMLRDFLENVFDVMYNLGGFQTKEVTLSGATFQDNDLIGADVENIALFNKGMELTTSIGSTFTAATGTLTFATSKSGSAKLYYR